MSVENDLPIYLQELEREIKICENIHKQIMREINVYNSESETKNSQILKEPLAKLTQQKSKIHSLNRKVDGLLFLKNVQSSLIEQIRQYDNRLYELYLATQSSYGWYSDLYRYSK